MELQRALFHISGAYCASCKPIVEKQLKDERAIEKIDIDIMTDSVTVGYDAALIPKNEIKGRAGELGISFLESILLRVSCPRLEE